MSDAASGPASGAVALVERLRRDGLSLAVAESCTGGLVAVRVTDVPGASAVFVGGVVAYADAVKVRLLEVPEDALRVHGAVSAAVVEAMAHGARDRFGTDLAVAVSGVAGPEGAVEGKPLGTVWVAVLGPERLLNVRRFRFDGGRDAVRGGAVREALRMVLANVDEAEVEGLAGAR